MTRLLAGRGLAPSRAPRMLQRTLLVGGAPINAKRLEDLVSLWEHPTPQALAKDPNTFWSIPSALAWAKIKGKDWPTTAVGVPTEISQHLKAIEQPKPAPSVGYGKLVLEAGQMDALKGVLKLLKADDPRLRTLIEDPDKWAFASERELLAALEGWAPETRAVPESFARYRQPTVPEPLQPNWPPAASTTAQTYKDQESQFSRAWGACGVTGMSLLSRLHDLGGQVERIFIRRFVGAQGARELAELITADVREVTLLNMYDRSIHEFTLEKHPGPKAVLHQGYLGTYTALWFAGLQELTDAQLKESINVSSAVPSEASAKLGATAVTGQRLAELKASLSRIRDEWGKGQVLSSSKLNTFADNLAAFVAAGTTSNPGAAEAWKRLPFQPAKDIGELGDTPIGLEVAAWVVKRPEVLTPQEWLTSAVLLEAASWWEQIAKFKPPEPEKEQKPQPKSALAAVESPERKEEQHHH